MAVLAKFNLPYPNRAQRSRLIRERSVASWSQNTNVPLAPEPVIRASRYSGISGYRKQFEVAPPG